MFCMKPQGGFAFSASKHSTNSHVFPPLYSECCFIESLTIRKSSLFVVIPCRYNFRASLSSCVVSLSSCVFLCLFFTVLFNFRSMLCCRFWRIKINISADTALLISAVSWSLVCCCSCELCFYGKTNGNVLATFSNRASAHIRRLLWNPDIFPVFEMYHCPCKCVCVCQVGGRAAGQARCPIVHSRQSTGQPSWCRHSIKSHCRRVWSDATQPPLHSG